MALIQSVPDDEIAAELAASLPADEQARFLAPGALRVVAPGAEVVPPAAPIDRRRPGDPRDLREATERVRPVALAHEQTLPLSPALDVLFPAGLRRGSLVTVGAAAPGGAESPAGATSLALALTAAATQAGSWAAVVGLPSLGLAAADELGLALERLAVIETPPPQSWAPVLGALVGAFDLVCFGTPARVTPTEIRRLRARARERGSVLVHLATGAATRRGRGVAVSSSLTRLFEADGALRVLDARWHGLGVGHGHLRGRQVTVEVTGRQQAARPRCHDLWLPDPDGRVVAVDDSQDATSPGPVRVDEVRVDEVRVDEVRVDEVRAARRDRWRRVASAPVPVAADLAADRDAG